MKDKLIGALVGLARATDGQDFLITPTATALIVRALNAPPEAAEELLHRAAEEKRKIVPNCATCAAPCGRTADYDMEKLRAAAPEVREAKMRILTALCLLAFHFRTEETPLLYKGLIYIGLDGVDVQQYRKTAEELERALK